FDELGFQCAQERSHIGAAPPFPGSGMQLPPVPPVPPVLAVLPPPLPVAPLPVPPSGSPPSSPIRRLHPDDAQRDESAPSTRIVFHLIAISSPRLRSPRAAHADPSRPQGDRCLGGRGRSRRRGEERHAYGDRSAACNEERRRDASHNEPVAPELQTLGIAMVRRIAVPVIARIFLADREATEHPRGAERRNAADAYVYARS